MTNKLSVRIESGRIVEVWLDDINVSGKVTAVSIYQKPAAYTEITLTVPCKELRVIQDFNEGAI